MLTLTLTALAFAIPAGLCLAWQERRYRPRLDRQFVVDVAARTNLTVMQEWMDYLENQP